MSIRIFDYILDLLYPKKCVFCGKVIDKKDICNYCAEKLPYTTGDQSLQKFAFISECVSPLYYEDRVRESFLRYKFSGEQSYAVPYGRIMTQCVENNLDYSGIDVISCVPPGATLSECARVLRKAGAKRVYAATLARHKD